MPLQHGTKLNTDNKNKKFHKSKHCEIDQKVNERKFYHQQAQLLYLTFLNNSK
jgi:hypothetical protein